MHRQKNWDHLRYVVAVAEAGSISQAARDLAVNHATVLRHVAAFEAEAGTEIFDKSASGYSVHDDKMRIVDAAREVGNAVSAVHQISMGARVPMRGAVRLTSTDSFCQVLLPTILSECRDQLDGMKIELLSTNVHLDFSRLRADITLRPASKLGDELRGVVAAKLGFAMFHAKGKEPSKWLEMAGPLARTDAALWMSHNFSADDVAGASDSFLALREMAAAGLGKTVLPCFLADPDDRLVRVPGSAPISRTKIWVASHVDMVDVPRIKAVRQILVAGLGKMSKQLAG